MRETLRRYVAGHLLSDRGAVEIGDDDDLLGRWAIDSIGMMSLVLFVEETFAVRVPPEDVVIENFFSISAIDAYLRGRRE